MLMQYGIPLLITLLLVWTVVLLIRAITVPARTYVEIIISGDDVPEDVENAVITAKRLAEKYFENASVYVKGQDNIYINAICRRFGIERKE